MRKLLLTLGLVLVLLLVAVGILFLRFDPDALGARLVRQINEQSGIRLEAERFTLHPLRGLELIDARASGRVEAGDLRASIALLRLDYQVLPLLRGVLAIDEVLLVEPRVELRTRSAAEMRQERSRRGTLERPEREQPRPDDAASTSRAPSTEEEAAAGTLRLSVERLDLEDGTLRVLSQDGSEVRFLAEEIRLRLDGLSFEPEAASSTEAVAGRGRLATGRIVQGDVQAERASGQLRVADGRAELTELEIQGAHSDLMVSALTILLTDEPPSYRLSAAGGVDLNGILGLEGADGFGPVGVDLEATGAGPELPEMVGAGQLILNSGSIPGLPSIVQIEELIGQPLLTGREYQRAEIDYRIEENGILLQPFEIEGDGATIGGEGRIDLAGPLDLEVFVRLPRRRLEGSDLDQETLDTAVDGRGMVTVPFRVTGTIEEPQVELTWEGLRSMAEDAAKSWAAEALEDAKEKALEWLRSQGEGSDDGKR